MNYKLIQVIGFKHITFTSRPISREALLAYANMGPVCVGAVRILITQIDRITLVNI